MPQLLFQFKQNGSTTETPMMESLVQVLSQSSIKYDGIKKHGDAVSVDFSSPEEAKNAYKTLDGMELMGSYLTIKPGRNENSRRRSQSYSQSERNDYSRDQDGYPEYGRRKQYNGYNNMNSNNSNQSEQYPCRILIPSDMVKVILGKGGATITTVQNKTNTKIDIHRDKGPISGRPSEDTLTTIKGDPASFSYAINEMLTVMEAEYEKREEEGEKKLLQLKLLAHDLLCGRIIGKAGANLKQVKQDSGVNKLIISNSIYEEGNQFYPNGSAYTGERVITIEGSVESICAAEVLLSKRLRDYMEKDMKNSANTMPMNGYYGGGGGGGGGMYGNNMGYPMPPPQMYQKSPYGYGNPMAFMGYPTYPGGYMNYPGILGHGQGYSPYGQNLYTQPQCNNSEFENEEICVLIPTKEVGAIIGRNGGYISRMKQYSGAQIRVVKGEDGGESRVEIKGPPDAQWKASVCVFSKIKETMKVPYTEAQLKTEYLVPGTCVGRVIGRRGQVVQDIQDKSQTDIEVPKDKQGGDNVPVYITGTFNGTQVTLNRIRDIVHRALAKSL